MYQESSSMYTNDKTQLTEGRHPAFLCLITLEDIPTTWQSYNPDRGVTEQWRWHFAVWESDAQITTMAPEHQTTTSTKTFSPGGTKQASKTYVYVTEFLRRNPHPDERVDLDPLLPLPCTVRVMRHKKDGTFIEYANLEGLEKAPHLDAYRTPELCQRIMNLEWVKNGGVSTQQPLAHSTPPPSSPPPARGQNLVPSAPPTNPGMVGWANPAGAALPPPTKPTW
jgi:hypothetical protein